MESHFIDVYFLDTDSHSYYHVRFDQKNTRDDEDRFAFVRKIWDIFIENCERYYISSNKCTVDKQLLSFRGRCRMYMKTKYGR